MNDMIINTEELVKSFGSNFALDGLDLQIPKGISGFVGKNGAGKTTAIGVILGLLKANRGEATVFGLDCWRDSYMIRRRLGVMHEINAYPNSFTGKRLLEHVAQFYNISLSDQSVDKLLRDVGLAEARDKPIKAYSAGMTRRLGLAQALIGNPELVILDEPTANIDPLGRITLLDKIKEMHKAYGTSFFISTHILSDLEKVCSWLSIIDSGKIVDQGKINDLAGRYSANIYKIDVSMPELFLEKIKKLACVENSWVEGDKVFCRVRDLESFCLEAPRIITENKLLLRSFQQSSGTLEEIYAKTAKRSQ